MFRENDGFDTTKRSNAVAGKDRLFCLDVVNFAKGSAIIQKIPSLFRTGFEQSSFNDVVGVKGRVSTNHAFELISFKSTVAKIWSRQKGWG